MRCPKAEYLSAFLDGELQQADKTVFESHLKVCTRCTRAILEMRALKAEFRSAEPHKAPFGFSTKVMARVRGESKKKQPWFVPVFIKFTEAAVAVVVMIVGLKTGKAMMNSSSPAPVVASSFSLEIFEPTPPGSLGGAYFSLMETGHEK